MSSESALMNSAKEALFRVQESDSVPWTIRVIALDPPSEDVLRKIMSRRWNHAKFLSAAVSIHEQNNGWHIGPAQGLYDLAGSPVNLEEEISNADLILMLATRIGNSHVVALIGELSSASHANVASVVLDVICASDEEISQTLAQLRPWSLMVVVAKAEEYIVDMLTSLRA
jgi:hypothetical protein